MRHRTLAGTSVLFATACALLVVQKAAPAGGPAVTQSAALEKGGEDISGPYEVVPNWPQRYHEPGWTWSVVAGVVADSPNRVVVVQRGELPVLKAEDDENYAVAGEGSCCVGGDGLPIRQAAHPELAGRGFEPHKARWKRIVVVFDAHGKLIESWDQWDHLFASPHRIEINPYDRERHVWVADQGMHQVFKFSNDGKRLVMTLGEAKVRGSDRTHLDTPTDMTFAPNGDIYVTNAGVNARIVRFSKDGQYIAEFGRSGSKSRVAGGSPSRTYGPLGANETADPPGAFANMHGIALDAQQRIYVADRNNSRVQVLDTTGKVVDIWPNIKWPEYIGVSQDQHVWIADGQTQRILKYDLNGRLLYYWGTIGGYPGELYGPNNLATDSDGNLYVSEVYGGRVQKFRPRKGADPTKLIGGMLRGAQ